MHNTAKQTSTGEVMAHFNLSDAEWDGLPSFVQQKLATVYYRHAAAPAMYEALSELVKYLREEVADEALDTWTPVFKAAIALAQAEGKQ